MTTRFIRRVAHDTKGSYLVEFAMISLPLITILMGGIELGYLAFAKSNVEGALREVSRLASTGTATEAELDALIELKIGQIANSSSVIEKRSYSEFSDVAQPEPLVSDVEPFGGTPSVGDCYLDINDNDQWDSDQGSDGLGTSEEILFYGVTVTYPMLFGLTSTLINGGNPNFTIEANAVIKNEPFGNVDTTDPVTRCITA